MSIRHKRNKNANVRIVTLKPIEVRKPDLADVYEVDIALSDGLSIEVYLNEKETLQLNNAALNLLENNKAHAISELTGFITKNEYALSELAQAIEEKRSLKSILVTCYYDKSGRRVPVLINKNIDLTSNVVMYSTTGEAILYEEDATSFNVSHMFIFEGEDFREEPVRRETDTEIFVPVSSHMLSNYTHFKLTEDTIENGHVTFAINKESLDCRCVEVPDMLKNIKVMNQIN